jgi:hypothetical protein
MHELKGVEPMCMHNEGRRSIRKKILHPSIDCGVKGKQKTSSKRLYSYHSELLVNIRSGEILNGAGNTISFAFG